MITTWRIVAAEHAATAFTGRSASLVGGRWNSKGNAVVYTATSASLAALELLVHLTRHSELHDRVIFASTFSERLVEHFDPAALPPNWQSVPSPARLREIGDEWIKAMRSAVLKVPSVIVAAESNYLLNPGHRAFPEIEIADPTPFTLDLRLLRR